MELLGKDDNPNVRINDQDDKISGRQHDAVSLLWAMFPSGLRTKDLKQRKYRGYREALTVLRKLPLWKDWLLSPEGKPGALWCFRSLSAVTP